MKKTYIKAILFTSLLLLVLILTLVSCKKPPEPIRMFDMNSITQFTCDLSSYPESMVIKENTIHLLKSNAHDTENFMIFKNIIEDYETEVFNIAKNKASFNTNLELSQKDFEFQFDTSNTEGKLRSYILVLNLLDEKGILSGPEHSIELSQESVVNILNSSIINVEYDKSSLPQVKLSYDNQAYNINHKGNWNYFVFSDRYSKEAIVVEEFDTKLYLNNTESKAPNLEFLTTPADQVIINVYKGSPQGKLLSSETLFPASNFLDISIPEYSDNYYVELTCSWNKEQEKSYGELTYNFLVNVELKESFILSKESYQPGDLIILKGINIDEDLNYIIESNLYNQGLQFSKSGNDYYLLLPIMSKADIGNYTLSITDADHLDQRTNIDINIVYKEFDVQYLETSASTATLQNDDNYTQLNEAFARGRENLSSQKLWDGKFIQPVTGRISTEYGQIRYTNGSENSSRHSGIDFATPTGTVIVASQNGYVTLAESLNITGNTLFIDHGFGIVSQYYHTDKIYVNVGDYVKAGQAVAEVGTTGFSTGPHLHFSIYNNGIYLNPWKFFEEAPF